MEFDTVTAVGLFVGVIALGFGGLYAMGVMATSTLLMMVLPAMVVFGLITFGIGLKHGAYRAGA
jgi:hypothetical protein